MPQTVTPRTGRATAPIYLDDDGNPVGAMSSAPVYLDDNGNPLPSGQGYQSPPGELERQQAWSMSPARDRAAARRGQPPAPPMATEIPTPSPLGQALSWAFTPVVSDEAARRASGAIQGLPGAAPPLQERGMLGSLKATLEAFPDIARNLVQQPVATLRGFAGGAMEGAGQFSTPMDIASFGPMAITKAARPLLKPALKAIGDLERAIVSARQANNLDEVARLAKEMQAARKEVGRAQALIETANAVDRGAAGVLTAAGLAKFAEAKDISQAIAGAAETALGAVGMRTPAPVRVSRPSLPAGRGFIADDAGRVVPVGEADRLSVPAERRLDVDPSVVTAQRAPIASREFEGRTVKRQVYSGDPNAVDVPLIDLTADELQGLRWLKEELDSIPFVKHGFREAGVGRGGDLEVIPGAAGAPIYDDLVQVRGSTGTRGDFIDGIEKLLNGEQSALGQDALVIARRLMSGDRALQRKMLLPPDAGDTNVARLSDVAEVEPVRAGGAASQPQAASALDDFEQFESMVGNVDPKDLDPGEFGRISPTVAARGGGAIAGATYGAATGETPEERAQRAVAFGVGGALAPSLVKSQRARQAAAAEVAGANLRRVPGPALRTAARSSIPHVGEIPKAKLLEFPSLQKMPEETRQGIADILEQHGGFAAQRRGVQSLERTHALAERIEVPLRALRPGKAFNAEEMIAHRDAVASVMAQREPLVQLIKSGQATDLDKLEFKHLTDQAVVLVANYRGAKAEAGRALNILRTNARVLEYGDTALIEQAIKAPGFDGDMKRLADEIAKAGDDPQKQLEVFRKLGSGTVFQKIQSAYYNSLLSGVKTHLRNTIGNSFNMAANLITPLGAAPIDAVRSRVKGTRREVYIGEIPEALSATFAAMPNAFRGFLFTIQHGYTPGAVERAAAGAFDAPRVETWGGAPTNWPSRLLEASDVFFRRLARDQELHASAYAAARRAGLNRPEAIKNRMVELLTGSGAEARALQERAEQFAARAVFQEDPGALINTLLRAKSNEQVSRGWRAVLTFTIPFVRTPANILRQGLEASPAGFAMKAVRQGGREGSQALGRAALGSAALAPLAWLASTGQLSGNGPTDPGERAALYEKGWMPNAVKIGDRWIRYQLFQPLSVPAAAVANAWEQFQASDHTERSAEDAVKAALGTAGSFLNQSFLSGVNGLLGAVTDPQRNAETFLSRSAQGLVPGSGLLRNVTQAVDPVIRKPEGIAESIKTIVPGLSQTVPPRRGRQGQVITRPGSAIQRGFLVPEVSREVTNDPVAALWDRVGLTPQVPSGALQMDGQKVPLTREQTALLQQARGEARRRVLLPFTASPRFERLPIETQRGVVENATADASRDVTFRAQRLLRRRQPLTLDALVPAER